MANPKAPIPATTEDQVPARKLYVQLATRITTQALHYRAGDEETAAESVSKLFEVVRELLTAHPKALAFEIAALAMLNGVVRPYTARWHGWMVKKKFRGEAARRKFRAELQQLRPTLEQFQSLLVKMADTPAEITDAAAAVRSLTEKQARRVQLAEQGGPVQAGIGSQVHFATGKLPGQLGTLATARDLDRAEHNFIRARREALKTSHPGDTEATLMNATALCLSGGGIRSATFCLGIVQVLVRQGIFNQLDYLSTVSGGGYLGTFLSTYLGTADTKAQGQHPPPSSGEPGTKKPTPAKPSLLQKMGAWFKKKAVAPRDTGTISCSKESIDDRIKLAFDTSQGKESDAIRHLRNNSRYLISGGLWARFRILGLLITGVATNLLLLLPLPLLGAAAVYGLRKAGFWGHATWSAAKGGTATPVNPVDCVLRFWEHLTPPDTLPSPALAIVFWIGFLLAVLWFLLPAMNRVEMGAPPHSFRARWGVFWKSATIVTGLALVGASLLYLVPALCRWVHDLGHATSQAARSVWAFKGWEKLAAIGGFLSPLILGPIAARLKKGTGKNIFIGLFALSGPVLLLLIFLLVCDRVLFFQWSWLAVCLVAVALALWGFFLVDVNSLSPRGYYRDRLCDCYLAAPGNPRRGLVQRFFRYCLHGRTKEDADRNHVRPLERLPLSQLNETCAAPYHLINGTVNLPSSREPNLRGRASDFFMFSRDYCGGPVCGYFKTREVLEKLDAYVDTGTAMAISGAAASSNMGVKTMAQFRFLLALLNIRLGYWLPRPQTARLPGDAPGPWCLFREMFGWMHEKTRYVNVSDGGHIENLALYEMLRRRCKYMVVVDGGQEPGMECADLILAQRYAAIDLGVRLEFDLSDLTLNADGFSRAYAVLGKVHYGDGALGWLVYLKLACTGEELGYVLDYRRQNRDFPHQSTGDQIYDEAQFEAYRRLGEEAAQSLFRDELARRYFDLKPEHEPKGSTATFKKIEHWFGALATSFLPDNDDDAFPCPTPAPKPPCPPEQDETAPVQT